MIIPFSLLGTVALGARGATSGAMDKDSYTYIVFHASATMIREVITGTVYGDYLRNHI